MKDAFVPSSVLRLRRRLSEDKMINIDIADVLFAGMVFPVMKFVKKIVLPRVRKAWEKVKERIRSWKRRTQGLMRRG